MRLIVFGGWGQLGSELAAASAGRHELVRPDRADVDVTDAARVNDAVAGAGPDAAINAAAFHQVESCEAEPEQAFRVNTLGALNVARAARRAGARCVFVSSDYVFDGRSPGGYAEDDPVRPLNVYGASKAAGEWAVINGCPDSIVVRGSGLFGHAGSSGKGGNFVETMLAKAQRGEPITVVDDQVFAPTSARDMAERILMLLERLCPPGTYHLANTGACSWYQFARRTLELAGMKATPSPRPAGDQGVKRPAFSVLLDTKTAVLGLPANRSWEQALDWYLRERAARNRR